MKAREKPKTVSSVSPASDSKGLLFVVFFSELGMLQTLFDHGLLLQDGVSVVISFPFNVLKILKNHIAV